MARRTKIEAKPLVQRSGDIHVDQGFVALEDLGNCFHRISVQIVLLDFCRVEAGGRLQS